jgi:hypothetical protein
MWSGRDGVPRGRRAGTVDPDAPVQTMGLVHRGAQFLNSVGGARRDRAHGSAAAAHDLDVVDSRLDEPPDHLPHALRTVGLAAEVPAVPAGHGHRAAAQVQPRQDDVPQALGAAQLERRVPHAAAVAQRRDPGAKRGLRVVHRHREQRAVGLAHRGLERRAVSGKVEMHVTVDQPRQQRVPGELHERRVGRPVAARRVAGVDAVDRAAVHDDRRAFNRRGTGAVEQPGRAHELPFRWDDAHSETPSETRTAAIDAVLSDIAVGSTDRWRNFNGSRFVSDPADPFGEERRVAREERASPGRNITRAWAALASGISASPSGNFRSGPTTRSPMCRVSSSATEP